jgi:hypothetical protein
MIFNFFAPVELVLWNETILVDTVKAKELENAMHFVMFNHFFVLFVGE